MKLALFFTTGMSLSIWEKVGNLQREIAWYQALSNSFEKIYLLSYGAPEAELRFQTLLDSRIIILPNKWHLPRLLYSVLVPFLYRRVLRDVDVYKTNQMSGAWSALIARWLYGKKLVVRCGYELLFFLRQGHASALKVWATRLLERRMYRAADAIILTSEHDMQFVHQEFKIDESRVMYLPNYVDTELFAPHGSLPLESKAIFVGRLVEQKNLFALFEALSGVSWTLTVVGKGPLKNALEEKARELKLSVAFIDAVANTELPTTLNAHRYYLLPSLYEGSPKTLIEAMATGRVCVGTKVPGIQEIIIDGKNGILAENTSSESITGALRRAAAAPGELLGSSARETIVKQFSLTELSAREVALYKNILNTHSLSS